MLGHARQRRFLTNRSAYRTSDGAICSNRRNARRSAGIDAYPQAKRKRPSAAGKAGRIPAGPGSALALRYTPQAPHCSGIAANHPDWRYLPDKPGGNSKNLIRKFREVLEKKVAQLREVPGPASNVPKGRASTASCGAAWQLLHRLLRALPKSVESGNLSFSKTGIRWMSVNSRPTSKQWVVSSNRDRLHSRHIAE